MLFHYCERSYLEESEEVAEVLLERGPYSSEDFMRNRAIGADLVAEVAQSSAHAVFDGDDSEGCAFVLSGLDHLGLDVAWLQTE